MVNGISGISDINFLEGYDFNSCTFDKSKTRMVEKDYLNYCRTGANPAKHIDTNNQLTIDILEEERVGIINKFEKVLSTKDIESLVTATTYPLFYREKYGNHLSPYLMVFEIGKHKVKRAKYVYDGAIGDLSKKKWPYICPDNELKDSFGYHLQPGIIHVKSIFSIDKFENSLVLKKQNPRNL